jgi:hypothetical protein
MFVAFVATYGGADADADGDGGGHNSGWAT